MSDLSSRVAYKQLEEDCRKWFNLCDELSTERRHLERKINRLESENATLVKKVEELTQALKYIDNVAPAMYKYNEVEFEMVSKAREVLNASNKE